MLNVFVNISVSDLVNGYTDSTTRLIEQNRPGSIYTNGKFHLFTAV
jgi:hypothetical protein